MTAPRILLALLALIAVLAVPALAAKQPVNADGVGDVTLGATHASLKREGLVGRQRKGCEFAGPRARTARLRGRLEGLVELTNRDPRKVKSILVTKGAAINGVDPGDTRKSVLRAFPDAKVERGAEKRFGLTVVQVGRADGGPLQIGIGTKSRRVELLAVPYILFCD